MRQLFIILLFFIINSLGYAQISQSTLIGEWKVVSLSFEGFYLNTITDSIHVSEALSTKVPDSLELNTIVTSAKMYSSARFVFGDNGFYTQKIGPTIKVDGTYKINAIENKITVILNESSTFEMQYKLIKNQMHLIFSNRNKSLLFVLDKINE